jgi:hypothetical protein
MATPGIEVEQHFTPTQLAGVWKVAPNTIRRLFENEDGVLIFGPGETRYGRRHKSMRIPQSVAARVHRKLHEREQ